MQDLSRYLGLLIIMIGAILLVVIMALGEPSNTLLATSLIIAVVGLLVQIFMGRAAD